MIPNTDREAEIHQAHSGVKEGEVLVSSLIRPFLSAP